MGKVIAIILCRGGSKGLPDKNIKDFNGKPLMHLEIYGESKYKAISLCI